MLGAIIGDICGSVYEWFNPNTRNMKPHGDLVEHDEVWRNIVENGFRGGYTIPTAFYYDKQGTRVDITDEEFDRLFETQEIRLDAVMSTNDGTFGTFIAEVVMKKFDPNDLKTIQDNFHSLILKRVADFPLTKELWDKNLPSISNMDQKRKWFKVLGMYGGFAYQLLEKEGKPVLLTESWCRVVGGSGQRHEVTTTGYALVADSIDL